MRRTPAPQPHPPPRLTLVAGLADKQYWKDEKPKLAQGAGLPFGGNLPFLVDGDTKLVQSNTILRHIGRKYNLMGDGSPAQDSTIDLLLDQMGDFDDTFTMMCYGSYSDGGKESYVAEKLPTLLAQLAEVLGDKPFMVCGEMRSPHPATTPSFCPPFCPCLRPEGVCALQDNRRSRTSKSTSC